MEYAEFRYMILAVAVAALIILIIFAARWLEKRVRSGAPAHPEFKDEWLGDDTGHGDDE